MTDKDIKNVKIDTIETLIESIKGIGKEYVTINDLERIKQELIKMNGQLFLLFYTPCCVLVLMEYNGQE